MRTIHGSGTEQQAELQAILDRVTAAHAMDCVKPISVGTIFNYAVALRTSLEAAGATWVQIQFVGNRVIRGFDSPHVAEHDVRRASDAFMLGYRVEAQASVNPTAFVLRDLKRPRRPRRRFTVVKGSWT